MYSWIKLNNLKYRSICDLNYNMEFMYLLLKSWVMTDIYAVDILFLIN